MRVGNVFICAAASCGLSEHACLCMSLCMCARARVSHVFLALWPGSHLAGQAPLPAEAVAWGEARWDSAESLSH